MSDVDVVIARHWLEALVFQQVYQDSAYVGEDVLLGERQEMHVSSLHARPLFKRFARRRGRGEVGLAVYLAPIGQGLHVGEGLNEVVSSEIVTFISISLQLLIQA